MQEYTLNQGIKTIVKNNKNTPRSAFVMYAKLNNDEPKAGLYYLMSQLLFQGTTNRTSEQLASDLDENAIDISVEKKADYIRFKIQCLNEDIELALSIFQDIIENSTFDEEIRKSEKNNFFRRKRLTVSAHPANYPPRRETKCSCSSVGRAHPW